MRKSPSGSRSADGIDANLKHGLTIPSDPVRTIDLSQAHGHRELANDYYYHLMDFRADKKLGCVVLKDRVHLIRGHFGALEDAEDHKSVLALNERQNIHRADFHFCGVKLSPNGNATNPHVLCLGDNFGRLLLYDYLRGAYVHSIYKRNECRISAVDWRNHFNARSGIIAAGSLDKTIRIYDDRACRQMQKLKHHRGEVCGLRWNSESEHLLLSGGNQNAVCVWDLRNSRRPLFVGRHRAAIRALAWLPHSDRMFVSGGGSNDQAIKIWDTQSPTPTASADGEGEGEARLSLRTGSQVCNVQCMEYNGQTYLVSSHGFSSNSIIVWRLTQRGGQSSSEVSLTRVKQLAGHKCRVLYLCKYSDSNIVSASAGPDQTLRYWKIFPQQTRSPFMHHTPTMIR